MASIDDPIVVQMETLIARWEELVDPRAIFLRCYRMMTRNVLSAIAKGEFQDPAWVDCLLHRFAEYYFVALDAYEQDPAAAPQIWQLAHNITCDPDISPLQKLLLGVNAHINYDLVLTVVDLLEPDWASLSESQRASRYADHCHVNEIIGCTIDAVQDEVLEPAMPVMDLIDTLLGPVDEILISRLIAGWREAVWQNAVCLLETAEPGDREPLIRRIEQDALKLGDLIALRASHL